MGKKIGWIPLHRSIQECSLWGSSEPFDVRSAWVDLLLMANHEDKEIIFDRKSILVKAGQRITSLHSLATRWRWSRDKVRRYLALLEELHMITRESDNRKTTLTIVNYRAYNDLRNTDNTTDNTTRNTADNTTDNTTRNTTDDTADNTQTTIINNDIRMINNDKNKKKKRSSRQTFGEYKHVRLTEEEFNRLCEEYGEVLATRAIKKVDEYCQQTGKTYKDYNLTIRNWGIRAAKEDKTTDKPQTVTQEVEDLFNEWDKKFGGAKQ